MKILFQLGYVAIAVVYGVTGYLTFAAAMGWGGRITDHEGSLQVIHKLPGGRFMLLAIAIGLLCYAAWRFAQAFLNADQRDKNLHGYAERTYEGVSGLVYLLLARKSLQGFWLRHVPHQENAENVASAEVMAWTAGELLLAIAVIGLFVGALHQIHRGISGKFLKEFKRDLLSKVERGLLMTLGRYGIVIRGLSFAFISYFTAKALWTRNPNYAKGTEETFIMLAQQPFGRFLLSFMALGFLTYGLYCLLNAKARDFPETIS